MGPFLPDAVRQHAALIPGAPAVTEGSRTLTYAELDRRGNRVAQPSSPRACPRAPTSATSYAPASSRPSS